MNSCGLKVWLLGIVTVLTAFGCKTTNQGSTLRDDLATPPDAPTGTAPPWSVTRDGEPVPVVGLKPGVPEPSICEAGRALALGEECRTADEAGNVARITELSFKFQGLQNPTPGVTSRRDFHPKQHGCLAARLVVAADLDQGLRVGAFANPATYKAVLRYSNGSPLLVRPGQPIAAAPDTGPDARGLAIKIVGLTGDTLLTSSADRTGHETQDFVMISFPSFFSRNAASFVRFFDALVNGGNGPATLDEGERQVLGRTVRKTKDLFAEPFWSESALALGDGQAVRVTVKQCPGATPRQWPEGATPNFLRERLAEVVTAGDVCLRLMVNRQVDPVAMPVEDSAAIWDESDGGPSPLVEVARLTIPAGQNIDDERRDGFCENLSFNPWNGLKDHRPLGSINRVRRDVYFGISNKRRQENHVARAEPTGDEDFFDVLQ